MPIVTGLPVVEAAEAQTYAMAAAIDLLQLSPSLPPATFHFHSTSPGRLAIGFAGREEGVLADFGVWADAVGATSVVTEHNGDGSRVLIAHGAHGGVPVIVRAFTYPTPGSEA